ncbi:MAG: gamma carbonic anhydrase family protein [Hasllibacter sp.]
MIYALDGVAPRVHPGAWIAPDANVIGDVVIEAGASVWFGATLRGDNERITVGAGSNVQEGCILHTDMGFPLTIGADCTIGHGAILHGCTLGEAVLVGMGATVLNGAVIGAGSLVGAGALVTEGKAMPERALLVGAPAKVARTLDAAAVRGLAASAAHYRANAARFRDGLREAP